MTKTVFITGSTDGIGLAAAELLAAEGHRMILHGRNAEKLEAAKAAVTAAVARGKVSGYLADLSSLAAVGALAEAVAAEGPLDAIINNAGILRTPESRTAEGLDIRFAVNTIAPYLLTRRLLPSLAAKARVVNVSSAAQAPVDLRALAGDGRLGDMAAYAQSKLAITMWSRTMAEAQGPAIIAVNPGSLLGSKMVREGFGVAGGDIGKGARILAQAATADTFAEANGKYFDNDAGRFGNPHPDALDPQRCAAVVQAIEDVLSRLGIAP
ncbi:MAG: SDR family NAD(P)-dependent oxidoreductase [Pseudomonadota bacterium]